MPTHLSVLFTDVVDAGPDNSILRDGSQSHIFGDRIGKTHVAGFRAAQVWQAKGETKHLHPYVPTQSY
jgi:hypothetical protein